MKLKNIMMYTGLFSVLSLTYYGCGKDDDDDNTTPPAPTPVVTAKIDGTAWSAISNGISGSIIDATSNVTFMASDSSVMAFSVQEEFELNETYDIGPLSGNAAIYSNGTGKVWASYINSGCIGELTITAINKTNKLVSGTFSFTAHRAADNSFREITEGVFTDVSYKTSNSGYGNSFSIQINGTQFNSTSVKGNVSGALLMLTSNNGQGETVGIELPFITSGGNYQLTSFSAYKGSYDPLSADYAVSVSGTLLITSHNFASKTITGTCNYIAEPFAGAPPSYNLSNGTFSINYY